MNKPICIAKKAGIVAERGKASIEWYKDGKPQYYCYGYMDKSTDYYIEVCRNCKNNVIYAQDDMDEYKELSRMNNQCHMLTCRYNVNAKCISDPEYKICTDAVKSVLGEDRYDSFLTWGKLEIKKKRSN